MKYYVHICVYFVLPHLPFIGSVTIDFNSIGYIGESTVLQCQDTPPITAVGVTWYRGGSLTEISSSKYTQTKTPTGFNLTISSLVTADAGDYHCGIDFEISTTKSLTIYYNTTDVTVTKQNPHAIEITFIAFPDPVYVTTVKRDGVLLDVIWTVYKSIQASGAIMFLLRNSTVLTYQVKVYTVHVNITSPVSLDVERNITWGSDLTAERHDGCAPKHILGLALGVGLGNDIICILCLILILIFGKNDSRKFIPILGFSIICVACIACLSILVMIGDPCDLKLGLGLGLGLGIPFVGCIIVIVIMVKIEVNIQNKDELQKPIPEGRDVSIRVSVHRFCISSLEWMGPHGIISDDDCPNHGWILFATGKYKMSCNRTNGIITLQISSLKIDDSGLYTCRAIGISGPSVLDSVRISVYENLAVHIDFRETGHNGSDVKIICSVYGSENNSVEWTGQEENVLTNDGRYTIAPYDIFTNKSCLTISSSTMTNDEGYICQVELKKPGVSVKIYITVSDNGSLPYSIEKIILFVPASEYEDRKWFGPQENILTDTGRYTIVTYDIKTNKSHLTIKDFSNNDNGSYTCQPKNSYVTSPTYSIKIEKNVLKAPENGQIKSGLLPMLLDIPKHHLQPTSPENSDVEDQNLRGITANFDDSQGLPTSIRQTRSLPPVTEKQPTVEKEGTSEKPKNKTNKKKKGKVNEGNQEEMVELNRKLPEDQSDED